VFDFPRVFDAKLVGELNLRERILEQLEFLAIGPWPGQLVLIENSELHSILLVGRV
jgi:hypothetical protein